MVRGKLFLLVSALSLGKEIKVDRDKATIDILFKELQDIAHNLPKTIALGVPTQTVTRTKIERASEQPEGRSTHSTMGTIDHSRLPPEVVAVLARTPRPHAATYNADAEY